MSSRLPVVRSILAVAAGEVCRLALLAIFVLGVMRPAWFAAAPGWKPGSPPPATPAIFFVEILFMAWILLVVGPVGGYLCARVAGRRYLAHGLALAILSVLLYVQEVLTTSTGQPSYAIVATFIVDPAGVMLGAYLYSRRISRALNSRVARTTL